jgi:thiol-disulfide isomerase/thioredoxin
MRFVLLLVAIVAALSIFPNPVKEAVLSGLGTENSLNLLATQTPAPAVKPVEASQLKTLLANNAGKPVLLQFSSKYCHDCQRMAPHMEKAQQHFPTVAFIKLDVMDPEKKQWVQAFQPMVTPTLVSISPSLQVTSSVVGYQEPAQLETLFETLSASAATAPKA